MRVILEKSILFKIEVSRMQAWAMSISLVFTSGASIYVSYCKVEPVNISCNNIWAHLKAGNCSGRKKVRNYSVEVY